MERYEYETPWDTIDEYTERWYWFEVLLAGDQVKDAVTLATELQDAIDNIKCWYDDLEEWQLIDIRDRDDKPCDCEVI